MKKRKIKVYKFKSDDQIKMLDTLGCEEEIVCLRGYIKDNFEHFDSIEMNDLIYYYGKKLISKLNKLKHVG